MEPGFRESDWKLFRELRQPALDRFCQRVLDEVSQLIADTDRGSHERYLAVYRLLRDRDQRLAAAFDDPRRSTALVQLARIQAESLLTEAEFARFSDGARASVQVFLDIWRAEPPAAAAGRESRGRRGGHREA
jgi:hypothetical protein